MDFMDGLKMRRIAKVDDNQKSIVAALRGIGAKVQPMHAVGAGFPDLLVAYRGSIFLLEVKDGKKPPSARKLTAAQVGFHSEWDGYVCTVKNTEEAIGYVTSKTNREFS